MKSITMMCVLMTACLPAAPSFGQQRILEILRQTNVLPAQPQQPQAVPQRSYQRPAPQNTYPSYPPPQVTPGYSTPQQRTAVPGQQVVPGYQVQPAQPVRQGAALSNAALRNIDAIAVQLKGYCRELHDEYHHHLEGVRHAARLDEDVTALEQTAEALHQFVVQANGSPQSMARLRADTNEVMQLSLRISRTIDLTAPWLRTGHAATGITHMRQIAQAVTGKATQIDAYLPVDTQVIDGQAERLEAAVKELHDEYHEHLDGYEISSHLDEDIEELETLVEHMHELAHGRSWQQIDFNRLLQDIAEVKQKTAHIESLFVRQATIGVRQRDWIGIEHSRDAITDVLASAYLLEHMVRKSFRPVPQVQPPQRDRPVPRRDRHGHEVRPRYTPQPGLGFPQ